MKTKKQYTVPSISYLSVETDCVMQAASSGVNLYKDTETNTDDVQYSRQHSNVWGDDQFDDEF